MDPFNFNGHNAKRSKKGSDTCLYTAPCQAPAEPSYCNYDILNWTCKFNRLCNCSLAQRIRGANRTIQRGFKSRHIEFFIFIEYILFLKVKRTINNILWSLLNTTNTRKSLKRKFSSLSSFTQINYKVILISTPR